MAYHFNRVTGQVSVCRARIESNCPFRYDGHYENRLAAEDSFRDFVKKEDFAAIKDWKKTIDPFDTAFPQVALDKYYQITSQYSDINHMNMDTDSFQTKTDADFGSLLYLFGEGKGLSNTQKSMYLADTALVFTEICIKQIQEYNFLKEPDPRPGINGQREKSLYKNRSINTAELIEVSYKTEAMAQRAFRKSLNDPETKDELLILFLEKKKSMVEDLLLKVDKSYTGRKMIDEINKELDSLQSQQVTENSRELESVTATIPGPKYSAGKRLVSVFKGVAAYWNPRGEDARWDRNKAPKIEVKSAQAAIEAREKSPEIEAPKKERKASVYYTVIPKNLDNRARDLVEFSDKASSFEGQLLRKQLSDLTTAYKKLSPADRRAKKAEFVESFEKLEMIYAKLWTIDQESKHRDFAVEAQYIKNLVPDSNL